MSNGTFAVNVLKPGEKKRRATISSKVFLIILPFVIWIGMSAGLYYFLYLPVYNQIQTQKERLKTLNHELINLGALYHSLESQQAMYLRASGESIDWSPKLIALGLAIPEGLRIKQLSLFRDEKGKGKPRTLDIYGRTCSPSHKESLDRIATFIEEMNRAPSFRREFLPLEFIYSQVQDEKEGTMEFKVSALTRSIRGGEMH